MALLRYAATVGAMTMISRVLGFARDILIAALLGAGPVADAFFVAFKLPNFFRRLFAEGAFNAGFVPLFTEHLEQGGKPAALAFAQQALAVLLAVLLVFVTLAQVAMPWLLVVLAPGFVARPETYDLAVLFTRITFPYLLFISLVSLLAGILNGLRRFAAAAATPILLNLCLIGALVAASPHLPSSGHALSAGVALAGIVQFVWLCFAAHRAGALPRLPRPRLTAPVRRLLRLMLPAALGAGVVQVNLVVDIILASLLPVGSISYLFYADRLNQLPIGVVGVAVGTALLPLLSGHAAKGDRRAAQRELNRAIELALLLALPAMAAFVVVAGELVTALFQRGAFDAGQSRATALALAAYAVGLPAYVLIKLLGPAYFAVQDTASPFKIGALAVIVNVGLNILLMQVLLHVGLALATAISAWLNVALLAGGLARRDLFVVDRRLLNRLVGALVASLLMALALWSVKSTVAPYYAGPETSRILGLAILIAVGLAVYTLAAFAFGAVRLDELKALLRRRRAD